MIQMHRPENRAEFERGFHLMQENDSKGGNHYPQDLSTESFDNVRCLPNGRIDFLSVDELARNNANSFIQFADGAFDEAFKNESPPSQAEDRRDKVT